MSPHEKLVLAIIVGVVFAVTIAAAFHWWILDVQYWFRWLRVLRFWLRVLRAFLRPLPDLRRAPVFEDDWQREPVTDQDADQLIAEWRDDSPGQARGASSGIWPDLAGGLHPWHERMWWDDPDLTVWDARQAALRCWEILHIEFPRLRAELGIQT